jgi:hypothetical protein
LRFRRKSADKRTPALTLVLPKIDYKPEVQVQTWAIAEPKSGKSRLTRVDGGEDVIDLEPQLYTVYGAAVLLAANYHLPATEVIAALRVPIYSC